MSNMIISYYSLGCKVNLYESEAIINKFIDNGFTLGKFNEKCDVYLINTCSVTEVSDAKSRKIIRQAIKQNENAVVAVMGCYAQLKPEDIKKIEGVDVLIGTSNRDKIYDLIMEAINNKTTITCVDEILNVTKYEELKIDRFNDKTRGFIKIEDGCDNYCSYCTIPYARGHVRSRLKDDVIFEIKALTNSGIKEIVLAGINTGHYGKDLSDYDFSDLLDEICIKVNNLGKLRISSIEMTEITEKLLNTMKKHETHFTPDGKIQSYTLKNEFDQLLEYISYDEKGQVISHGKTYYDENGIQRGYEDLTEKYALQDQGRMKVYHDEKGAITKTVERATKGVIVITEYKNNKEIVKEYAPKDHVYWEEPDLNNINWNNYELMPNW